MEKLGQKAKLATTSWLHFLLQYLRPAYSADGVAGDFHLIPRVVDASEVGDAVAFLCSDSASGITGTDLAVDGGYTAIAGEGKVDHVSRLMG